MDLESSTTEQRTARILVMGAGTGGISQVYELRRELGSQHAVVLIGDSGRLVLIR